jgi:lipopolysaccharide export system protein LptA
MSLCRWIRAGLAFALLAVTAPGQAEQADRFKPTLIEFDRSVNDELNQVAIYTGDVRLTRGTLVLTGQRMELRQTPDGFRTASIAGTEATPATFRQRLDPRDPGIEEHVEGDARRIEYDERTETVRFSGAAHLRRLENAVPRDEISGELIVYNARDRTTTIDGRPSNGNGRGRVILAPQTGRSAPDAPAAPGAHLRPDAGVGAARK